MIHLQQTVPKRAFYGTVPFVNSRISAAKRGKRRAAPNTVNGTVPPRRLLNAKRRPREYLTVKEVDKLVERARARGRYGRRDATMILVAYRHALRSLELCGLRWDQVDLERGLMHVRRLKSGTPSVLPMGGGRDRSHYAHVAWRRGRDSNPRYGFPYTHFPGVRLRPLGHPSAMRVIASAAHNTRRGLSASRGGPSRSPDPRSAIRVQTRMRRAPEPAPANH